MYKGIKAGTPIFLIKKSQEESANKIYWDIIDLNREENAFVCSGLSSKLHAGNELRSDYLSLMKHMHINSRCLTSSASEFRDRLKVQIAPSRLNAWCPSRMQSVLLSFLVADLSLSVWP